MSEPNSAEQPALSEPSPRRYRRPRADLYTVLLILALAALIVGTIMLYVQQSTLNFELEGNRTPERVRAPLSAPAADFPGSVHQWA